MKLGELIDWKEITKGCRVFLIEQPDHSYRAWILRKLDLYQPKYELLIFSNKTIKDLPSQWTGPKMPEGLTSLERFQWRQDNELSTVCDGARRMIEADGDERKALKLR